MFEFVPEVLTTIMVIATIIQIDVEQANSIAIADDVASIVVAKVNTGAIDTEDAVGWVGNYKSPFL